MGINNLDKMTPAHLIQVVISIVLLIGILICFVIEIKNSWHWIKEIIEGKEEESDE